ARLLTRAIDERVKPNGERVPQFRDSARESLELELFSTEPIYDDYEILRLTDSLTDFASQFGADNPLVQKVLTGKSPHARAVELVSGTKQKGGSQSGDTSRFCFRRRHHRRQQRQPGRQQVERIRRDHF